MQGATLHRAGFSLLEVAIASTLVVLMTIKISMVISSTNSAQTNQNHSLKVEEQARRVVDQIAYAIMGANRDSLLPVIDKTIHTTEVRYEHSLGVEEGEIVWSAPQRLSLSEDGNSVVWQRNYGDPDEERSVVWTRLVRPVLEGEFSNGSDDNANGLEDEEGLHFVIDNAKVTIRLTLELIDAHDNPYLHTAETTVLCRNFAAAP